MIADRHAVGGRGVAVGRLGVHAAGAAGREDRRLGGDQLELAVAHVVGGHARCRCRLRRTARCEVLFVDLDAEALELLPQRVQDHEAGDVGRVARARGAGAAEGPLRDPAVGHAREDAAAVLEPDDLARARPRTSPRSRPGRRDNRSP